MVEVHISADELARRTGIPASTIKKIRNNNSPNPTLNTLLPLAEYFAVSLGQLVGDEPLPESRTIGQYKNHLEKIQYVVYFSISFSIIAICRLNHEYHHDHEVW